MKILENLDRKKGLGQLDERCEPEIICSSCSNDILEGVRVPNSGAVRCGQKKRI